MYVIYVGMCSRGIVSKSSIILQCPLRVGETGNLVLQGRHTFRTYNVSPPHPFHYLHLMKVFENVVKDTVPFRSIRHTPVTVTRWPSLTLRHWGL
jgi:hypothetical protein